MANIYQDPQKLRELNDAMMVHRDVLSEVESKQRALDKAINRLDKNSKKYEETLGSLNKQYDVLEKQKVVVATSLKGWEKAERKIRLVQGEIDTVGRKMTSSVSSLKTKSVAEYNEALKQTTKLYRQQLDELKARGMIGDALYSQLMKKEADYHKVVLQNASERTKMLENMKSDIVDVRKEAEKKWSQEFFGGKGVGGIAGGAGKIVGIESKTLSGAGGAFKAGMGGTEQIGGAFKNMLGMMKDAGGGVMSFAGAMKALGLAMKGLNWIGLLVGGLKAVVSVVNELDGMMKKLNQSWREMAGSPALLKNVRTSMKEFNDSIFDVGRNMRLGLKSSDIQEFFKAMSTGGLSLEGVKKKMGGYNEAIEEGFRLSRQFGVSFSEMGTMMSSQMMNLRSSLDDVNDAFKTMSYGAAVAGVSSQKFYQVVENVSMSLSFYGNHLKTTSGMLAKFVETGTMGFKDASETVENLMGTFKKMGIDQRRALVNIVGEDKIRKWYSDRAKDINKAIEDQEAIIKAAPDTAEGQAASKTAQRRSQQLRTDQRQISRILNTRDITNYAANLEMVAERAMEAAISAMNEAGVDFFSDITGSMAYLGKVMGWSIDEINKATKGANVTMDIFQSSMDLLTSGIKKVKKEDIKALARDVQMFYTDPTMSSFQTVDSMMEDVGKRLSSKEFGLDPNEVGTLLELIRNGGAAFADVVNDIIAGTFTPEKWGKAAMKHGTYASKEVGYSNEALDQMVKQTTPIADYLHIGKENVKYALAGSNLMANVALATANIADKAGGILAVLTSWFKIAERFMAKDKGAPSRAEEAAHAQPYAEQLYKRQEVLMGMRGVEAKAERSTSTLDTEIGNVASEIAVLESRYEDVSYMTDEARKKGMELASEQLEGLVNLRTEIDAGMKKQEEYATKIKKAGENTEERIELERVAYNLDEQVNKAIRQYNSLLGTKTKYEATYDKQTGKLSTREIAETAPGMTELPESYTKGVEKKASAENMRVAQDFLAKSGGIVNVSKGDLVVDSKSVADGIMMGKGQLMDFGAGIMKGPSGSGMSIGEIQLNFNAPMNGKPEDYRRVFVDAVEDVVNRKLYKEKSRI
jgi:exonuclease VII small subunit